MTKVSEINVNVESIVEDVENIIADISGIFSSITDQGEKIIEEDIPESIESVFSSMRSTGERIMDFSNITAGDIAGVYSVVKSLKFGALAPAVVVPIFFQSKKSINNLFPGDGRIVGGKGAYDWEKPYYKLVSKIEVEENYMKKKTFEYAVSAIKKHLKIAYLHLKFLLTVQRKDGSSLWTDLIAIACVALAILSLLPFIASSTIFTVLIEVGLLFVLAAVLEPVFILFKAKKSEAK